MAEFNSSPLFPPILVHKANIDVTDEWIIKVKEWCLLTGKKDVQNDLTTTFGCGQQPHQISWIMNVLSEISHQQTFVNSWVQVYNPGGFHPIHNHFGNVKTSMSGCLYLTEGPTTQFQNPLHKDQISSGENTIPGDVLLWDSRVYHFSPPVKKERIILAFNLI